MFRILVVEDDENTRKLLSAILVRNDYEVLSAGDGVQALDIMKAEDVDLVIVDVMMPRMDGLELTRILRTMWTTLPILMITAKQEPQDKHQGFLVGTDDYMTKPVDDEEMLLRIKALLRRAQVARSSQLDFGEVRLDYDSHTVTRADESITLPGREFELLFTLVTNAGRILTRLQLMDEVWGTDPPSDDHTLNVHIARLRERFKTWPQITIETVRGLGYRVRRIT